jgi:hypothetical protein
MPKYASSKHTEEEYEEWLGRMDISIEGQSDIELFQQELQDQISNFTVNMVSSLWEAQQRETRYEEHGINAVTVRYSWGSEVRYGIQGMSGLWGFEAIQQIRQSEEW